MDHLRAEALALETALASVPPDALRIGTPLVGWRGLEVLAHLSYLDRLAQLTVRGDPDYDVELASFGEAVAAHPGGDYAGIAAFEATRVTLDDPAALVSRWRSGLDALCELVDGRDLDVPVTWFGRTMALERLLAARQMEVFAYGQDVVDALGQFRPASDRLWPVADFAVRTLRFSFAIRALPEPRPPPRVELQSPSGAVWTWGDDGAPDRVAGPAEDLCLVCTQRRHANDTALVVTGDGAHTWMRIAQTIAGPPRDGPAPGERG